MTNDTAVAAAAQLVAERATGRIACTATAGGAADLTRFNSGTYVVVVTPAATTGGAAARSQVDDAMHVLMLPSWYKTVDKPWRGTFVRDQALALRRAGVDAGIAFVERRSLSRLGIRSIAGSHFQTAIENDEGAPLVTMKGWSTFAQTAIGSKVWAQLMRRVVRRYVAEFGTPDLVHGHAALWGGYAAMLVARDLERPYIVTEHSSFIRGKRIALSELGVSSEVYRNAAQVVAVSSPLKRDVDAIAGGDVADVVPNAVDTDFFHPPPARRRVVPFTFLTVADLVDYKGIDHLIRAFAHLRSRKPSIQLVIAGSGKHGGRFRDLATAYGLNGSVRFAGALPRASVREEMWKANALVLPSMYETFGVVVIEALATGLPVLATRCGGPEDIITSETGILVPPADETRLESGMAEMMRRTFDAHLLSKSARDRYGYAAVASRLIPLYDSIAGRNRDVA